MAPKTERYVSELGEHSAFWTLGNRPTQLQRGASVSHVLEHLKALYLLSDVVLGAASFYFESPITRRVTDELRRLFESGEIAYFVDETLSSLKEHGRRKIEKSPSRLFAYRDTETVSKRGLLLDSLGHIIRRPQTSISDRIVDRWLIEADGAVGSNTIGGIAQTEARSAGERRQISERLRQVAANRGEADFVWEFVSPKLIALGMSHRVRTFARKRLSEIYSEATAEMLGLPTTASSASSRVSFRSRYDSELFLQALETLGVRLAVSQMDARALMLLKRAPDFIWFREFYFSLIDAIASPLSVPSLTRGLAILRDAEHRYEALGVTGASFVRGFRKLCRAANIRMGGKPLEVMIRTHDALGRRPIQEFVQTVRHIASKDVKHRNQLHDVDFWFTERAIMVSRPVLLFLAANPLDSVRLRLDEEVREIDTALRLSKCPELFALQSAWAVRTKDLQDVLLRNNATIVHFSGHGSADGCLCLEDDFGRTKPVAPAALANLFRLLRGKIRIVMLNACFSEIQAKAIAQHVDCVVGMGSEVNDSTAVKFAAAFYRGLAYGKNVELAFQLACNEAALHDDEDSGSPSLLVRKGVDPGAISWGGPG